MALRGSGWHCEEARDGTSSQPRLYQAGTALGSSAWHRQAASTTMRQRVAQPGSSSAGFAQQTSGWAPSLPSRDALRSPNCPVRPRSADPGSRGHEGVG